MEKPPAPNSVPSSLSARYSAFIEQIVAEILKGKISSKEYIHNQLAKQLEPRTGEIFERCLIEQLNIVQHQPSGKNGLSSTKAYHRERALKTLQDVWTKFREAQQDKEACRDAVVQLIEADASARLSVLLQILDPNQTDVVNRQQIEQLAKELDQVQEPDADSDTVAELRRLATGLKQGLSTYQAVELDLVGWLYEKSQLGFGGKSTTNNPWKHWAKTVNRPLPQLLFAGQARNQSALLLAQQQTTLDLSAWVELMVLLQEMQNGLVTWFDKQPYSYRAGRDLAAAILMSFAIIWCELSNGFRQAPHLTQSEREQLSRACFQITLQILRTFARRDNFPLYGGMLASFSGESFRDTIVYLDRPLKAIEKTQEKARILTILGDSQQWVGNREQAKHYHEEALDLARQASDRTCEVANLNHLSRLKVSERQFSEAVDYGQRALLFARQTGDSMGETNALANLGYAEVRQAQQQEHVTALELEPCIQRLERGSKLAEKYHDLLSEVFCTLGLGSAHLLLDQASAAIPYLEKSLAGSMRGGNLELEGLSHAAIAEGYYQLNQLPVAVVHACLGRYLLKQKQASEEQQAANLVAILRGRLGDENFKQILQQQRAQIIGRIGVDGFDDLLN